MRDRLPSDGPFELIENVLDSPPAATPFVDKIRDEFHLYDILGILIVPGVLVGVYLLPLETRRALSFNYQQPSILTAFSSNYVHLTQSHLLSNLVGYLLLIVVAYLLALSNSHRTRFYSALIVILLAFPIPLSYLNLAVPRPGIGVGFSGLNMALFGCILLEFAAYLDKHFTPNFGVENAPVFFFIVTGFIAVPHAKSAFGLGIVGISGLLAILYSGSYLMSYRPSVSQVREALDRQGYFELLLITAVLCLAFVPIAFPQDPTTESGIVNIYIHQVGFSLGFITVYVWVLVSTPADPQNAIPYEP